MQTPTSITVATDDAIYADTVDNFIRDHRKPLEAAHEGLTRQYEQGVRHCFTDGKNIRAGGPREWKEGDTLLDGIKKLVEAKDERLKKERESAQREFEAIKKQLEVANKKRR